MVPDRSGKQDSPVQLLKQILNQWAGAPSAHVDQLLPPLLPPLINIPKWLSHPWWGEGASEQPDKSEPSEHMPVTLADLTVREVGVEL